MTDVLFVATPLEGIADTARALAAGEWLAGGLHGVATAADLLTPPHQVLAQKGVTLLLDNMPGLTHLMDVLAGDHEAAVAFAQNVRDQAASLTRDAYEVQGLVANGHLGLAATRHAQVVAEMQEAELRVGDALAAVGDAATLLSQVITGVRDFVSGLIAELIVKGSEKALLTALTGGAAAVVTGPMWAMDVSRAVARAERRMGDLTESTRRLDDLLIALANAFKALDRWALTQLPSAANSLAKALTADTPQEPHQRDPLDALPLTRLR